MELVLYRGAQEIIAELEVDPDTGEIGTEFPLDLLVQRNPIGSAGYVLHTQAQMKMVKARIDELQSLHKAAEKRAERVKESLKSVMQLTGTTSIESPDCTFRVKLHKERDKSVEIWDENQIPADYMREIPARYEPDKILISKAIKDGFEVAGARIVAKDRLEIR
jgi:hypothetical protein